MTQITFRLEKSRSLALGIIDSAGLTFYLWIAGEVYRAAPFEKSFIAAGSSLGFLLAPALVRLVSPLGLGVSTAAGLLYGLGAVSQIPFLLWPKPILFTLGSTIGLALNASAVPFVTQLYQDNFPADQRGRLYAQCQMIRIVSAILFSLLAGLWFEWRPNSATAFVACVMLAFAWNARLLFQCPSNVFSSTLSTEAREEGEKNLSLFNYLLLCWMLMGMGHLLLQPLRVDFLVVPTFGIELTPMLVALMTTTLPNLARLGSVYVWGRLFDRSRFIPLRCLLNLLFAVSLGLFFHSSSLFWLAVSSLLYGFCLAGGELSWNLWVTRYAQGQAVAGRMATHAFLTGSRGVLAPFIGFYLMTVMVPGSIAVLGCSLMVLSSLLLLKVWKR